MNTIISSTIRGSTIAVMILISSIFSGTFFDNQGTSFDNQNTTDCADVVDFHTWLGSDNLVLPISVSISFEMGFNDLIGTYNSSFVTDQYLGVFPNNTHQVRLTRVGYDQWYESFYIYNTVERGYNDAVSIKFAEIASRLIDSELASDYIFALRNQLQSLFNTSLHEWNWNQVLAHGHSDNEYREITVTFLNTDGTAIILIFQENGIMISGEYARFFHGDYELKGKQIEGFVFDTNAVVIYGASSCRIYYSDTDNFGQTIQAEFLQYMAQYISDVV